MVKLTHNILLLMLQIVEDGCLDNNVNIIQGRKIGRRQKKERSSVLCIDQTNQKGNSSKKKVYIRNHAPPQQQLLQATYYHVLNLRNATHRLLTINILINICCKIHINVLKVINQNNNYITMMRQSKEVFKAKLPQNT